VLSIVVAVVFVVVLGALGGVAASAYSDRQPELFEATTQLLYAAASPELEALGFPPKAGDSERSIVNDVVAAQSFEVARQTARTVNSSRYSPGAVAASVVVTAERNSDVATITATASSPREAALLAMRYRQQVSLQARRTAQERAREGRLVLERRLRRLPSGRASAPSRNALRNQLGALMILERTGGDPVVVQDVRASAQPVSPQEGRNLLVGVLAGAGLALGVVAVIRFTRPG